MTVMAAKHPILSDESRAGLLERRILPDEAAIADCTWHYQQPDPAKVDLSFAGRLSAADPSLPAIASI